MYIYSNYNISRVELINKNAMRRAGGVGDTVD